MLIEGNDRLGRLTTIWIQVSFNFYKENLQNQDQGGGHIRDLIHPLPRLRKLSELGNTYIFNFFASFSIFPLPFPLSFFYSQPPPLIFFFTMNILNFVLMLTRVLTTLAAEE